jgi:hypothetical protein
MGLTDRRALTGGRELAARRTAPGFVSTGRAGPDHCLPDPWIPTCSPARSRPVRDRRTRAPQRLKGLLPRKSMQASCTARSLLGVCTPLGQVGCASGGSRYSSQRCRNLQGITVRNAQNADFYAAGRSVEARRCSAKASAAKRLFAAGGVESVVFAVGSPRARPFVAELGLNARRSPHRAAAHGRDAVLVEPVGDRLEGHAGAPHPNDAAPEI